MACWVLFSEEAGGGGGGGGVIVFGHHFLWFLGGRRAGYGREAGQALTPAQLLSTSAENKAHNWPIFTH